MGRGEGSSLLIGRDSTRATSKEYPLRADAAYSDPRHTHFEATGECPFVSVSNSCKEKLYGGYCPVHGEVSHHTKSPQVFRDMSYTDLRLVWLD